MKTSAPLTIWALILLVGAGGAIWVARADARRVDGAAVAATEPTFAELFRHAQFVEPEQRPEIRRLLGQAAGLTEAAPPSAAEPPPEPVAATPPPPDTPVATAAPAPAPTAAPMPEIAIHESIGPPDGAARLLRVAMSHTGETDVPRIAPLPAKNALAALDAVTPGQGAPFPTGASAYGALEADVFAAHRLNVLQLGDSHTAADLFTGHVRERLQQVFGLGGEAYIVPGKPHGGVRSALFDADASEGWTYEALQKPDAARQRFYLSGFNAVARRAGAALTFRSRGGRPYDRASVAFLKEPGGGRAEVLVDGASAGAVNLDGPANTRAQVDIAAATAGAPHGFHEIVVRAATDGAVTVTGVQVARDGDGVSFVSLGFPGATVQLLQKLTNDNLAEDFRRLQPDVVVLAFGTNEGFNDNLDVPTYIAQYEQIVRQMMQIRPGVRIVIVGPPDAARPNGVCHAAGVGQACGQGAQVAAEDGGGGCRYPTPPKLSLVRDAQRKLADKLGAWFWDWSSVMPGPCGAQTWAAANPPLMARDYVHMTLEGYKQSADRFADFLIPLIEGRQTGAHVVSNN